jgi:hypothetical protein
MLRNSGVIRRKLVLVAAWRFHPFCRHTWAKKFGNLRKIGLLGSRA